jgi:FRG domain
MRDLPEADQYVDWLAIMQHYGAPTRLLDFTRSFYVAAFFAIEMTDRDCAIWAVNEEHLTNRVRDKYNIDQNMDYLSNNALRLKTANTTLQEKRPDPGVIHLEPFKQHERLVVQQGLFIMPVAAHETFETNLCAGLGLEPAVLSRPERTVFDGRDAPSIQLFPVPLVKIILRRKLHSEAMKDLARMNINAASLFAGLDGFARSLNRPLRLFDALKQSMS